MAYRTFKPYNGTLAPAIIDYQLIKIRISGSQYGFLSPFSRNFCVPVIPFKSYVRKAILADHFILTMLIR